MMTKLEVVTRFEVVLMEIMPKDKKLLNIIQAIKEAQSGRSRSSHSSELSQS